MRERVVKLVSVSSGVAGTALAWVLIVPWDMSEVDAFGRVIPGGGDGLAPRIGSVLLVVTGACCGLALLWPRLLALWASVGSAGTWLVMFAWRAAVSRTSGVNFWPVALVVIVLPCAVLAVAAVRFCVGVGRRNRPA